MNEPTIHILNTLNLFPEVSWDRYVETGPGMTMFYGWIQREDAHEDFIILWFETHVCTQMFTSSAKYTEEFSERLKFSHSGCKRVESISWADRCNCIRIIKGDAS